VRSTCKQAIFAGRLLLAAPCFLSKAPMVGELCGKLLVMGKQSIADLPAHRPFEKPQYRR
jgi:hypothetical protein